jgi:hypothetical protein
VRQGTTTPKRRVQLRLNLTPLAYEIEIAFMKTLAYITSQNPPFEKSFYRAQAKNRLPAQKAKMRSTIVLSVLSVLAATIQATSTPQGATIDSAAGLAASGISAADVETVTNADNSLTLPNPFFDKIVNNKTALFPSSAIIPGAVLQMFGGATADLDYGLFISSALVRCQTTLSGCKAVITTCGPNPKNINGRATIMGWYLNQTITVNDFDNAPSYNMTFAYNKK